MMEELEQIIGYTFQNRKLLKQALTHSSYANEKKLGKLGCNERLEFLGDAVLELVSSDFLYARISTDTGGRTDQKDVPVLSANQALPTAQDSSDFRNYLLLGQRREYDRRKKQGFDHIGCDGSTCLAQSIWMVVLSLPRDFVLHFILNDIERKQLFYDSKTIFQEIVQEKGLQPVEYVLTEEKGPDHDKQFTVEVQSKWRSVLDVVPVIPKRLLNRQPPIRRFRRRN